MNVIFDKRTLRVVSLFDTDVNNKSDQEILQAMFPNEFKNLIYVEVTAGCHSAECQAWANKRDINWQGSPSGFGRMFDGKIKIKNGFLIGEIYDVKLTDKILPRKQKHNKLRIGTPESFLNRRKNGKKK